MRYSNDIQEIARSSEPTRRKQARCDREMAAQQRDAARARLGELFRHVGGPS